MSRKDNTHKVVVTYKKKRGRRPEGVEPILCWEVKLDGEYVGNSLTLNGVSHMLYDLGYKTWAFRRAPDKKGRPCFKADVISFDKEKQ
jgi:hypothetical protein